MKHVFGSIEAISDTIYLATTSILGFMLLLSAGDDYVRMLAGIMALVLAGGDAFHLVPQIIVILAGKKDQLRDRHTHASQNSFLSLDADYVFVFII